MNDMSEDLLARVAEVNKLMNNASTRPALGDLVKVGNLLFSGQDCSMVTDAAHEITRLHNAIETHRDSVCGSGEQDVYDEQLYAALHCKEGAMKSDNTCKIHGPHCIDWSCKHCRDFGADEYVRRGNEITKLRADLAAATARVEKWQGRYIACVNKLNAIAEKEGHNGEI